MRKGITDHYHRYDMPPERANAIIRQAIEETRFQVADIDQPLFQGRIYDPNKIATRIHEGHMQNGQEAVLKIQLLPNDVEEAELMRRFTNQNASTVVRAAKIYEDTPYDPQKQYGYMMMEKVKGKPLFKGLMATEEERKAWLQFYQEMREAALMKPLFEPEWQEKGARLVTGLRMANWLRIARAQGHLDREKIGFSVRHLTQMVLSGVNETDFMHGHLDAGSVLKTEKDEKVLMSQAFWKYLPLYSDTVFHLWASLKGGRGKGIQTPEQALDYVEKWQTDYKKLDLVKRDAEFDQYFGSALRERCVGAIVVDIDSDANNDLKKVTEQLHTGQVRLHEAEIEREAIRNRVKALKDIFRTLFSHYSKGQ